MKFYEKIRARREELGMTQDELAKLLGYKSRSTIAKIEKGENDITQSKITAFAQALKTTPGELMGSGESSVASISKKIERLPLDKQKEVEQLVDDIFSGVTIAAHRTDDPTKDLPPEALASIEAFIAQMRKIYSKE